MSRLLPALWLALIVFAGGVVAVRCVDGLPLETDILSLLPAEELRDRDADVQRHLVDEISKRVAFLAEHPNQSVATAALDRIAAVLCDSGLALADGDTAGSAKRLGSILFPHRTGLLSADDRALLLAGDGAAVAERAMAQAMSPFGIADAGSIAADPFLLFPRYLNGAMGDLPGSGIPPNGKDGASSLLTVTLSGSAFDPAFQARFASTVDQEIDALRRDNPALGIYKAGAVFYAQRGLENGRREATVIGLVSLAGIVLLQFAVFRGVSVLFLGLLAVGAGLLCGAASALLAFGSVHVMTTAFGGSLIGLSVDYAFHYACQRFASDPRSPKERLARVRSALTLGFVSSLAGFLILIAAPFPALRQIAVFAAGGLTASYLTVVAVFPLLDRGGALTMRRGIVVWTHALPTFWRRSDWKIGRLALCALVLLMAGYGVTRIDMQDDIRRFQNLPSDLKADEDRIRARSGTGDVARAFVVTGRDEEETLQREEDLATHLDGLVRDGALSGYRSISHLVPSARRQAENRDLVERELIGPYLDRQRTALGAPALAGYANGEDEPLRPEDLLRGSVAPWFGALDFGSADGGRVHLVTLSGIRDAAALEALAQRVPGVRFVDQVRVMTDAFRENRVRSAMLLSVSVLVIAAFLAWRYRPVRALRVLAPPGLAAALTLPIAAAFGEPVTFFNVMGLILVFAIGLDFSLFCRELGGHDVEPTILANTLSAVSTILAFGLLSFSEMLPLHAFGVTVFIGIVLALTFAPLSMPAESRRTIEP